MQIIVCKRTHLLPQPGNRAAKPEQCFRAKAGATKTLQQAARIMKLTALLLLGACLHVHAIGFGQKISLSEREASIEKVFREIESQSNYKFLYASHVIQDAKKVTLTIREASIETVLDLVCQGQPFGYRIDQNMVVVKPRKSIDDNEVTVKVVADPIDVRGLVTDNEGRPLPGANVKVKGSNVGTTTDNDGRFNLKNVVEGSVLEISFIGYEQKSFTVRGSGLVNIALGQKLSLLDETVVIAYGTTTRRFATGNIATVKAVDIEKQPVQNPLLALQGRVPGIEVTQLTGLRGGGLTVRIQGQNSITSGLNPLIVIDGVPFPSELAGSVVLEQIVQQGSPLNYINPADIESIDILKDADATSIYGSRAANGAILITTKKGKAGRTKLSVKGELGWGKVTRKVDMMNTRQYLDMRYEAYRHDGIDWTTRSGSVRDLKLWDTTRDTDWQETLIGGTAKYTNLNIGMSGGTAAINYLVGATYNRQTAVFPGDFDDKVGGLHFNINGSSTNQKLRVQLTGSYSYDNNRLPTVDLTQQALLLEPDAPALYNADGTLNWAPNAAGNSSWNNPLAYTLSTEFNNTTKNLVTSANIAYTILPGLEIRNSAGYTNTLSEMYRPIRLDAVAPEYRPFSERQASYGYRNMTSWIIEPQIQYKGQYGKIKIDGLVGTTIQKTSFNYLFVSGSGFPSDLLMKTLSAAKSVNSMGAASGENRFNALFGRLNFSWADKYLVSLTARRDGSNKFGDKNKFHNFGSIGIGWIFSEEKFIKNGFSFLSFGKLRGSYGSTGNDQIGDFSYLSTYSINNPTIPYQNSIGLNPTNIPNPYLQWEKTRKCQVGIDLGVFQDRVVLGLTYARNRSNNQLVGYTLPLLTGFSSIFKNLPATIQNTSFEFTLNTVNVKGKNFSWNTNFNLTIPRNKLVSFPGIEQTSYADGYLGAIVGQPLAVIKVAKYAGMNPTNGQHLFIDNSGNPNPDIQNLDALVSTLTKYYGGIENTISFKGVQLGFLVQFVHKMGPRDLYWWNGSLYPGSFSSGSSNQPVTVLNRWQKPGDNTSIAPFSTGFYSLGVIYSDAAYNYDASFIRLKNVSLSWQLPAALLKKAKLQNVHLYANAQNLVTITRYTGLDPENMNFQSLPPLRMITTGIQVEF